MKGSTVSLIIVGIIVGLFLSELPEVRAQNETLNKQSNGGLQLNVSPGENSNKNISSQGNSSGINERDSGTDTPIDLDQKEAEEQREKEIVTIDLVSLTSSRPWEEEMIQGQIQSFQFSQIKENDSLIIRIEQNKRNQMGNLALYLKKDEVATKDKYEIRHEFLEFGDYYIVDHSFIQPGRGILGSIQCVKEPCDFLFYTQITTPALLDSDLNVQFSENTVQIFDFDLPQSYNRTHIYFQLVSSSKNSASQDGSFYGIATNQITQSNIKVIGSHYSKFIKNYDYAVMSFYGGQNQGSSCSQCRMRVFLNFPIDTELLIQKMVFGDLEELDPEEFKLDVVKNQDILNAYSVDFSHIQSDWDYLDLSLIYFNPEEHVTQIYIDNRQITSFTKGLNYLFYSEFQISELVIENDQDNEASPIGNLFNIDKTINKRYSIYIPRKQVQSSQRLYVYIQSDTEHPYFLEPKFMSYSSSECMSLELQQIISAHLNYLELMNYVLKVPESINGKGKKVAIALRSLSGQSHFFVAQCQDENCSNKFGLSHFNPDGTINVPLVTQTQLFDQNLQQIVVFNSDCDKVYREGLVNYCYFILGVRGMKPDVKNSFLLEATFDDSDHRPLRENQSLNDRGSAGQVKYYEFSPQNLDDIQYVEFQLSSPHTLMYISSEEKCQKPSAECNDNIGSSIDPVVLAPKKSTQLTYFIAVQIFFQTQFALSAEVTRKNTLKIVQLVDGTPQRGRISNLTPSLFFKYEADLPEGDELQFNLIAPQNQVMLLVSKNEVPDNLVDGHGAEWISHTGHLYLKANDKKYKRNATYYIAVWAKDHAFTSSPHNKVSTNKNHMKNNGSPDQLEDTNIVLQFTLIASTDKSIKVLELNQPMYDIVMPKSDKMYQIHVDTSQSFLSINRQFTNTEGIDEGDVVFYIGSFPSNKTEDYLYKITNMDNGGFLLKSDDLKKLCGQIIDDDDDTQKEEHLANNVDEYLQKQQEGSINLCSIYLAVENLTPKKKIPYTISANLIDLATELQDGHQYIYSLTHINNAMNFYYRPVHYDHSLTINLYSYFGRTEFSAVVWDYQNGAEQKGINHITDWPFPSSQKDQDRRGYNFVSAVHNSHSLTVTHESLLKCRPDCVVLISVSFMEEDHHLQSGMQMGDDTFVLIASSLYTEISNNQKLQFTLHDNQSQYFLYDLTRPLIQQSQIIIALTALSGRAIMRVSVSSPGQNIQRYPSLTQSDFLTYGNYLALSTQEILKVMEKLGISKAQGNVILAIDVFSIMGSGKFVLTTFTSDSQFLEVMHGLPQEIHLRENQGIIFKYFNYFRAGFKIKVAQDSGWADVQISLCQSQDIESCLENEKIVLERHIAGESASTIHITPEDTKLYCTYCTYFIHVQAEQDEGEFHAHVTVLLDQDVIWLQESRPLIDNLDSNQTAIYRLSVPPSEYVYMSVLAFSGAPEVYVNYHFESNYSLYQVGPYKRPTGASEAESASIHFRITPRQQMLQLNQGDASFNPYNRPALLDSNGQPKRNSVMDLTDYMVENEIFVLVRNPSKNPSNYSISFSGGDKIRYINDGQLLSGSLASKTNNTFVYYHMDENTPTLLSLYLDNLAELKDLQVKAKHDEMENRMDFDDLTTTAVDLTVISRHDNSVVYSLPKTQGAYFIILQNKGSQDRLNYTISINAQDITLVPFGQKVQHALLHGAINYYQFFIPSDGYVAVEFVHCAGDLALSTTQQYQNLLDFEKLQNQEAATPGHSGVRTYQVNPGAFYLLVISPNITETTVKGVPDNTAFYTLSARWYAKRENIPTAQLVAGDEGRITFVRTQGEKAIIQFQPIRCLNCREKELASAQVTYEVVWSIDQELLNVMGQCEANTYFEHNRDQLTSLQLAQRPVQPNQISSNIQMETFTLNFDTSQTIQASIQIDAAYIYYASVQAIVTDFPQINSDFPVFYDNVQLGVPEEFIHDGQFYLIAAGSSVLVIIFCFATFYFYGQFRKATQVSSYMKTSNPKDDPNQQNNFQVVNNSDTSFRIQLNDFNSSTNQNGYDNLSED